MARLTAIDPANAQGEAREVFEAMQAARGWFGNIHYGIANAPPVLHAFWHLHGSLKKAGLSLRETEAIRLIVSQIYGCEYCLAVHTAIGKKAGLSEVEILRLRAGEPEDGKLRALKAFVVALLDPQGRLSDDALQAIRTAGYSDALITAIVFAVALTVFTNLFNRVNQTELDPEIPPVVRVKPK